MSSYDLAVIGAGPGGYEAALRAREHGFKTALIEKSDPGGACLNTGCIPTKALLASTKLLTKISRAAEYGLSVASARADRAALVERKNRIVETLRKGLIDFLRRSGVEWIQGEAAFTGNNKLSVATCDPLTPTLSPLRGRGKGEGEIEARHILIAIGSAPIPFPGAPFDGDKILSSSQVLELKTIPPRLLILGGGVVGVEFASLFQALGTKVVLVEMLERLIANEDEEIGRRLESLLRRKGMEIYTDEKVKAIEKRSAGVLVGLESGKKLEADQALVALGRRPSLEKLNLEKAGIKIERGLIQVNEYLETSAQGVFAIGDVTTRSTGLAHGASAEGVRVVENLKGRPVAVDYRAVPACIYTDPEVASVGKVPPASEIIEARVLLASLGKSHVEGETEGFVKMAADRRDGRVLKVSAIGAHATELIGEAALAVRNGITAQALAETVHPHPTESEILQKVAELVRRQISA